MLAKTCLAALALAPAALAAPLMKKDDSNFGVSDPTILVLQFAATLEGETLSISSIADSPKTDHCP